MDELTTTEPVEDRLDELASTIRSEYRRSREALGESIDAYIAVGHALLEARRQLPSDNAFGAWFRAQEFGFSRQWAHTLRLAAEHEPQVRELVASQLATGQNGPPNLEQAVREARGLKPHIAANAGDNEWYTPEPYIAAARDVLGGIDLDPASTPEANGVVDAARFYTAEDNALQQNWKGRVWMNPPYARPLIDEFCAKLAESYATGDVSTAITLTNNATETGWFHALAEVGSALCFPRHRVKFWHPRKESTPLQGQALVYLGADVDAFRARFVEFGFTAAL
jgi:phage N-6-adenine-methyltransferase